MNMRRLLIIMLLSLLLAGCVPLWVMNQPEQPPQPPRPIDIPNIFYSDRINAKSVRYFKEKVLFKADISTSPHGDVEAFMADKDGKNNLQRLTFVTGSNTDYFITFVNKAEPVFNDTMLFITTGKIQRYSNPLMPLNYISGNPFYLFDVQTGNNIFEKDIQSACVSLPDKRKVYFIASNENAEANGSSLSLYVMGEDLQTQKVSDLPANIKKWAVPLDYNNSPTNSDEFVFNLDFENGEIKITTWQYPSAYIELMIREYLVSPNGSNLRRIKEKRERR